MNRIHGKVDLLKSKLIYEITSGVFRAGERLPGERELGLKYEISRNTVRLAIAELTQRGILERRARSGAYIAPQALELIGADNADTVLTVSFAIPPSQLENGLLQRIFQTLCGNLDRGIKVRLRMEFLDSDDSMLDDRSDVMIIFGNTEEAFLKQCAARHQQLILLNRRLDNFNYIAADDELGGRTMAEYIISCHHRRPGLVNFDAMGSDDMRSREHGIVNYCREAGVECTTLRVHPDYSNWMDLPCFELLFGLRKYHPDVTALLTCYDLMAFGLLNGAQRLGMNVPDDVSVIGFDDHPYARYTNPGLTTMKYPAEAIGLQLAEHLNGMLHHTPEPLQSLIAPLLVKRDSVKTL